VTERDRLKKIIGFFVFYDFLSVKNMIEQKKYILYMKIVKNRSDLKNISSKLGIAEMSHRAFTVIISSIFDEMDDSSLKF
jgi:hypothetical protein